MNKEIITKLVMSKNSEDIELAMYLLVGKTKDEIREMFQLTHARTNTLIRNILLYPYSKRKSYQISKDCIIYLGHNMSIATEKHYNHVDLTINYE